MKTVVQIRQERIEESKGREGKTKRSVLGALCASMAGCGCDVRLPN